MSDRVKILVINTGSTSTKLAIYENETELFTKSIDHSSDELAGYATIFDQLEFRKNAVLQFVAECGVDVGSFDVIASRGGAFGVFKGGAYLIDDEIIKLASVSRPGFKPMGSWLAAHIAYELANELGIKAYFYDAVFTDEMQPIAKYSGMSFIKRKSGGHPLNCKEAARRTAREMGKTPEECSFIVCHLGGGISSEMHYHGRIIDSISFTEGTFTPERAGRVPSTAMLDLFYSGRFATQKDFTKFMRGGGGLVDYLGTNSVIEVEKRIDAGDTEAEDVLHAMCYQVAKDIGAVAATVGGDVDKIILTGGIAHSQRVTGWIAELVRFIAPVTVCAGSFEMEALAHGIYRVYTGAEQYSVYAPRD